MTGLSFAIENPATPDVQALIARHLAAMFAASPPESVHALDLSGLQGPAIRFFTLRDAGELVGIGALKALDAENAELKSMHTPGVLRGAGLGALMLTHLIDAARASGHRRIWLETGTQPEFAPARRLYARFGFADCGPFAGYGLDPNSCFMRLDLG